jgi:hypothetical protein
MVHIHVGTIVHYRVNSFDAETKASRLDPWPPPPPRHEYIYFLRMSMDRNLHHHISERMVFSNGDLEVTMETQLKVLVLILF